MTDKKTELFPEINVQNRLPLNFSDRDISLFQSALTEKIPSSYYWYLENAIILKDTVFRHFRFWQKYSHLFPLQFKSKVLRLALLVFSKKKIEKGVWITDNWSGAYFHWFTDALTRLENVSSYLSGHMVLLPAKFKKFEFIWRSLELLGYSYTFLDDKIPCRVNKLILPSHTTITGSFNPVLINSLREKFLARLKQTKPFRKIYISRQRAKHRRFINEEQLLPELKKFNFEVHFFEDYSLDRQRELMSECVLLVSVHGAGLTNMLFMQPGNSVIEFKKVNDKYSNCYLSMASALDLNYYYIKCQGTNSVTQLSDFILDPEEMGKITAILYKLS